MRTRLPSLDPGRVALVCGVIFVAAGLVKFFFYHWELPGAVRDSGRVPAHIGVVDLPSIKPVEWGRPPLDVTQGP